MKTFLLPIFLIVGMLSFAQNESQLKEYIHTEYSYLDDSGKGIIIQNSYPKGGAPINGKKGYTAPNRIRFSNGNFWTRILNKSDQPVTLDLKFPEKDYYYSQPPNTYFKLLVSDHPLNPQVVSLFNYGYDTFSLNYFLDHNFGKATTLKKTIQPDEDFMFYVIQLAHLPHNGPIRAGLYAEGNFLIYKVNVDPFGEIEFEAGVLFND